MKPAALPAWDFLRASARPAAEADQGVPAESWQREMEKAQASMWLGHDPVGTLAHKPPGALQGAEHRGEAQAVQPQEQLARGRAVPPGGPGGRATGAGRAEPAAPFVPRIQLSAGLLAAAPACLAGEALAPAPAQHAHAAALNTIGSTVSKAASAPVEVSWGTEPPHSSVIAIATVPGRAVPPRAGEVAQPAAAGKALPAAGRDEIDPEAVRVYCQFTADGLMVWIGVAAGSGLNVQALAAQLQHALARQSQRLACLTCNGSAVALEPEPFPSIHHKEPTWPSEQ